MPSCPTACLHTHAEAAPLDVGQDAILSHRLPAYSRRSCAFGCGTRCHLVPPPACLLTPKLRLWMWDKMPSCPTACLHTHAEAAPLEVGQDAILSHRLPAYSRRSCAFGGGTRCHLVPPPACLLTPKLRLWMWDKMPSCPTACLHTHAEAAPLDVGQDAILSHRLPAYSRRKRCKPCNSAPSLTRCATHQLHQSFLEVYKCAVIWSCSCLRSACASFT